MVVKQESHIVGFACAFGGEDELFGTMLDNLHVLQSQKGKGIGRKLVRDIDSRCDRDYSPRVYTSVGF
jgi:predicted N-acetyltransferase YhbS